MSGYPGVWWVEGGMAAKACASFEFDTRVDGVAVHVECEVLNMGVVICNFSVGRRAYSFRLSKFSGSGQMPFIAKFFDVYTDGATYGRLVRKKDIPDALLYQSPTQKIAMLERATRDVFVCLSDVVEKHGREIINYAIWHRENVKDDDTYGWTICYMTCCAVIHADFMAGAVRYDRVGFTRPKDDEVAARRKRHADDNDMQ